MQDHAMEWVRQSNQTQYGSHVYQVEGDVDVLYLTNQITILFAHVTTQRASGDRARFRFNLRWGNV
jgi:hypothetical protein